MSEANRKAAHRWIDEIWNNNDFSGAHEYVAENIRFRTAQVPEFTGLDNLKEMVAGHFESFPDGHFTIDEELSDGDSMAHRWTFRGTQEGKYGDVEPTGRKVEVTGTAVTHFRDGKIVAHLADLDVLAVLQQLGAA